MEKKSKIFLNYFVATIISALIIFLLIYFFPSLDKVKKDNFLVKNFDSDFIAEDISSNMESLLIYDYAPIFLSTRLNAKVNNPTYDRHNPIEHIINYDNIYENEYNSLVLNKKISKLEKIDNIFHSNISEIMPYYKLELEDEFLKDKDTINISVIEVKSGKEIMSEDLKIDELKHSSDFFVPTEIFMNISDDFTINIADNTISPNSQDDSQIIIKKALDKAKIFQKINSGYYKIIISP